MCSSRSRSIGASSRMRSSESPSPRPGQRPASPALHRLPTISPASLGVERADVAAVDRGHRGHVARAEALELAHLDVLEPSAARLPLEGVVARPCAFAVAGDAGAHVHVAAAASGSVRACRRSSRPRQVGGRDLHHGGHLEDRLGRAPAVQRCAAPSAGSTAEWRLGVLRHVALDLGAQLGRHVHVGGVRAPWPAARRGRAASSQPAGSGAAERARAPRSSLTGPPRRGSDRAWRRGDHVREQRPRAMSGSACRFTKHGSRMCTRAGFAEPSATTKQPSSPRGDSIAL